MSQVANVVSGNTRKVSVPALAAAILVITYGLLGSFSVPHVPNAPDFVAAATFVLTAILDFVIPEQDQANPTQTAA